MRAVEARMPKEKKKREKKRNGMKKDKQLYEEKVAEMLRVYREVAPLCLTQKQALQRVCDHESSRFWIQPHTAYNKLRKVFNGYASELPVEKECDKEMYEEIYRRVLSLSAQPEHFGKSLRELCEIVVRQRAPKFYMKPSGLTTILIEQRKLIRERLRRLNPC